MKKEKKLGIWMDRSIAHVIEFTDQWNDLKIIQSNFNDQDKSEFLMHNKQQLLQTGFYRKLEAVILDYDVVLLFGVTNAKTELFNEMQKDHRFTNIRIDVKEAEKMNKVEKIHFLLNHFIL